jgi:hypothetical protein
MRLRLLLRGNCTLNVPLYRLGACVMSTSISIAPSIADFFHEKYKRHDKAMKARDLYSCVDSPGCSRPSHFLLARRMEGVAEDSEKNSSSDVFWGAFAGALATGPMTALMRVLHERLPEAEQYPLPPRLITMHLASRAGVAFQELAALFS